MPRILSLSFLLGLALPLLNTRAEKLGPWRNFKTEPTFEASLLNVTHKPRDPTLLSPDYLFFSLTTFSEGGPWGPQIFDPNGELVFFNNLHEHTLAVGDPHICDYNGESRNHFCLGNLIGGVRGRWFAEQAVYDNTYKRKAIFPKAGDLGDADGHENNMLPGGHTFLRLIYNPVQADLTPFAGSSDGWVHDVCFQEIDVHDKTVLFKWCYLEQGLLPIADTYIFMNVPENKHNLTSGIAGKGTKEEPWDFLHLNSADKNDEGDYLISARHLNQLLKIAGPNNVHGYEPGKIIWRLGGRANEFEILGNKDLLFSRQHHVRYVSTGEKETIITLFDNAWEGSGKPSAKSSSGKTIKVNNETMEASLVNKYPHPKGSHAMAQGSMVPLENGNVFVGWGWLPEYTEFSSDGEVLLHAKLAHDTKTPHLSAYRSYKFPWVAYPYWNPKLLAYSHNCARDDKHPLMAYVSWNGATEVKKWRFYVSNSRAEHGAKWTKAGVYKKEGFETEVELRNLKSSGFIRYVFVEALDSGGNVIGSTSTPTFVPDRKWTAKPHVHCGPTGCSHPKTFDYDQKYSQAQMCRSSDFRAWFALAIFFIVIEGLSHYWGYTVEVFMPRKLFGDVEKVSATSG